MSKGLALILSAVKGKGGESEEGGDDMEDGKQEAVRRFFEAGKAGDWAGASAALGEAMSLCEPGDYGDSE